MSFCDSNQTAAVKSSFDILYGAIPPHITKLRGRRLQRAFGTLYSEMCEPEGEQEWEQEDVPEPPPLQPEQQMSPASAHRCPDDTPQPLSDQLPEPLQQTEVLVVPDEADDVREESVARGSGTDQMDPRHYYAVFRKRQRTSQPERIDWKVVS